MPVKSFSNTYIFVFSTIMVILVAAILSTAAMVLQPFQQRNIEIEKKRKILGSIQVETTVSDAEELYLKYIRESYVVNSKGVLQDSVDAFLVLLADELHHPEENRNLPVFVGTSDGGKKQYIVPVRGSGLWGPIFGYVSLQSDFNTIVGTNFDHEGETPGLGSEITTQWFEDQFRGKKIFADNGDFVSIQVVKGGADPDSPSQVDAIGGSTITSKGLEKMLYDCLRSYEAHFKSHMN